jgi:Ohr subfamily peroxiredoxin
MRILYSTSATTSGAGRNGFAKSEDGVLALQLAIPKSMGGTGGEGTNPEQLFAAGYSACFLSALQFIAGKEKVKLPAETTVKASVGIGPLDSGAGFGLDVALAVSIPGIDRALGEDLVAKAHGACPYSNATRGNIDVELNLL